MTAETSNARGEWVLVPRELTQGMRSALARAVNASCNTDEWYAHTLAAAPQPPPPAAEGVQAEPRPVLSEPDRIGLYQGPDDCPQLMVNDRPVAIFPAGSWAKVCDALDSITGSVQPDPKPEARGVVDEAMVDRAGQALYGTDWGSFEGWEADQLRRKVRAVLTAALTEARNG